MYHDVILLMDRKLLRVLSDAQLVYFTTTVLNHSLQTSLLLTYWLKYKK